MKRLIQKHRLKKLIRKTGRQFRWMGIPDKQITIFLIDGGSITLDRAKKLLEKM